MAVTIHATALVCKSAILRGEVTIGPGCVVHPAAQILAEGGPIVIGANCEIAEQVVIANRAVEDERATTMTIGDGNAFETGATCLALMVGNNNVLECKALVGRDVTISNNCRIGAACIVTSPEVLQDNTVIFGQRGRRVEPTVTMAFHNDQRDHLKTILPPFHQQLR